jgi:serine/threonine protein kinase
VQGPGAGWSKKSRGSHLFFSLAKKKKKKKQSFQELGKIGEGTYGVVLRCRDKASGETVAVKCFKEGTDSNSVSVARRRRASTPPPRPAGGGG